MSGSVSLKSAQLRSTWFRDNYPNCMLQGKLSLGHRSVELNTAENT